MKQIFFVLILSIPLFSQYSIPPFGAKPAEVWQFLKIDPIVRKDTLSNSDIVMYYDAFRGKPDSLQGVRYTFYKDSLVKASYDFIFHGDLTQAVEFFEKKNEGYQRGHGSRQCFIKIEDLGRIWYDFTLPQVAKFLFAGHLYENEFYMRDNYRVTTGMSYSKELNLTQYSVYFISTDAYNRGILD